MCYDCLAEVSGLTGNTGGYQEPGTRYAPYTRKPNIFTRNIGFVQVASPVEYL